MQAAERALALREAQGDPSGVGRNLRWMSSLAWLGGRRADMERRLTAALEVLEVQPPGPDLAMAYSDLAVRIGLYGGQREEAERTLTRAVALAEDPAVLGTCSRVGLVHAALYADDARCGAASTGPAAGHHLEAGMAYQGLAWDAVLRRDWTTARRWIGEGVEYLEPREILGPLQYLRGLQATTELAAGDWTAAESTAGWVLAQPWHRLRALRSEQVAGLPPAGAAARARAGGFGSARRGPCVGLKSDSSGVGGIGASGRSWPPSGAGPRRPSVGPRRRAEPARCSTP